ncbi:hypothetical protein [Nonomuraea sediminis]|uniref:hypothetical protein n=1 Tax=Nonomuraea sediminis TaxID=2835864 RepID=UPI001BDC8DB0|nr:hypothetical protein [Nonomuraea sediminis]
MLAGAFLIGGAVHSGGAAEDRFLQCFGGQRIDLAVVPADMATTRPSLPEFPLKRVAAIDGVASVRTVLSGPVKIQAEGSSATVVEATMLHKGGLPLIHVIEGDLPNRPDEAVLDEVTAKTLVVHVGSTLIADGKAGTPVRLRLSGIIQVDTNQDLLYRGVLGVGPELAQRLVGRLTVDSLQVTLDPAQALAPVRHRIAAVVGDRYSVLSLQDVAAHRSADSQVLTLALATLGVTSLLGSMAVACATFGRIHDTFQLDASHVIAKYGAAEIRKLLVFDRVVGLVTAIIAGMALTAGVLVLLSMMGADLPCASVYSISLVTTLLPVIAFSVAISTAPVVVLARKCRSSRSSDQPPWWPKFPSLRGD